MIGAHVRPGMACPLVEVATMSIFGFYFVAQLLREAGWPRKQGMFKGQAYDTFMVDVAIAQSVDWAAALGAGRPRLSLQMIAEMFRDRDWDSDEAPNVKIVVDELQDTWSAVASPQDVVQPVKFAERLGRSMSLDQFRDSRMRVVMEEYVRDALLWGLSNPDRFAAWYSANLEHHESQMPEMRRAGLDIDELPPLPEFFANSEEIVRDYEREFNPLPAIPRRLLDDATALGWKISD
jgi:hypothetical protein